MTSSSSSPSPSPSPPPRPQPSQSHSDSPSPSPQHGRILLPPEFKSSPPKKSQPLPWTDQETLAIIQAYQEKWYSLKKGQLKAFQWEEVAVTVAARCGYDEPSKTSTQCRHKIEKLRKRYRSELQKPYPNSWQYFELMDQMERGPLLLNVRPITVASNNFNSGYGSLYSSSTDYYNNDGGGNSGGSDDSDEKWTVGHGSATATRNKSKSINNIVRGNVRGGVRTAKVAAVERGFGGGRGERVVGNLSNGRQRQYIDGCGSVDDGNDSYDDEGVAEEEERVVVEEGEDGGAGMALAAEVRGFTEQFMGMERKKMEMMKETEKYRMEMEKKRLEMIVEAQRKMVDTIGRVVGSRKRAKMSQES